MVEIGVAVNGWTQCAWCVVEGGAWFWVDCRFCSIAFAVYVLYFCSVGRCVVPLLPLHADERVFLYKAPSDDSISNL